MTSTNLMQKLVIKYCKGSSNEMMRDLIDLADFVREEVKEPQPVLNIPSRMNCSNYDQTLRLIRAFDCTGWHHILEIPENLFNDFWNIAERHPEILIDKERDYQYFKIQNFHACVNV